MKHLWNVYRFFFFLLLPFAVGLLPVGLCIYFNTEAFAWAMIVTVPACAAMSPWSWNKAMDHLSEE